MERFKVDGTSVLSWTVEVQAREESAAREEAQRILGWIDLRSSLAKLYAEQHCVEACRLIDPENE